MGPPESPPLEEDDEDDLDRDLLDYLQTLTPAERLQRHSNALELVRKLRAAMEARLGFDPRAPETADGSRR